MASDQRQKRLCAEKQRHSGRKTGWGVGGRKTVGGWQLLPGAGPCREQMDKGDEMGTSR